MSFKSVARLFVATLITAGMVGVCFADSIDWQPYSRATFAKAKKQHRPVLIFGKANWCPWCRRMKSDTFSDSTIISLINQHFIPVMVDIDEQSSIADQYSISVVPSSIIVNGDYRVIDSKTGYLNVTQMASFLSKNAKN